MDAIIAHIVANPWLGALVGFGVFGFLGISMGRTCRDRVVREEEIASETDAEFFKDYARWTAKWTGEYGSMAYGQLATISALLGAILVVLVLK